tara:strand:+ start:2336 stop:3412 length:1077 start_codon:yes stop_codon:yes gene_type:complete
MHPALNTALQDRLGCRVPIIQTAMGWIATPELVAATANAGGFGFLAGATIPPKEIEAAIVKTKSLTNRPFGLNFHMYLPGADEVTDLVLKHGVKAVSYGRGPSKKMVQSLKDAGVVCIPTVGAVKHAVKAADLGADIIVIQGNEGGGHTGSVPTSLLLPQVLDAVKVPVVAAGGFRDGRGLVAALAFGAVGIAMGTRFLLTSDSPVPRATLDQYLAAEVDEIIVSTKLDGLPQRMILNDVLRRLEQTGPLGLIWLGMRSGLAFRKLTGLSFFGLMQSALAMARSSGMTLGQTLMAANAPVLIQRSVVEGRPAEGVLPSGQVAGVIDDLPSCKDLIDRIVAEAEQRLAVLNPGAAPTQA